MHSDSPSIKAPISHHIAEAPPAIQGPLTVYKASAGSGKTYTLALEYIRLLLNYKAEEKDAPDRLNLMADPKSGYRLRADNRHKHILAITFTRKATNEMKTRIIDELNALSHEPKPGEKDSNYAAELMKTFGCSRGQLALASKFALSQLLFDYQDFNVSTIDAFFQRVLHTFARELDRQSDYEVELDDEQIMLSAVSEMLDNFNHESKPDTALEGWIYDYMSENIQEGERANLFNRSGALLAELVKQLSRITDEDFKRYLDAMEQYLGVKDDGNDHGRLGDFKKAVVLGRKDCLKRIQQIAAAAVAGPNPMIPTEMMMSNRKPRKLIENYFIKGMLPPLDLLADEFNAKSLEKYRGNNCSSLFKKGTPETAAPAFLEMHSQIVAELTRYHDLGILYGRLGQLGLLQHAWIYLNHLRNDNNLLLLSDANDLVNRIIGNDPTPFVYERMGVQLRNFLIDEFQDTSQMQWENLRPLVENGLSSNFNSLVIGDEKQSIYRWRNSDASILEHQVTDHFVGQYNLRGSLPGENTNYRTSGLIVRFNNTLFDFLAKDLKVKGYDNVIQGLSKKYRDTQGYVKFKFQKDDKTKKKSQPENEPKIPYKERVMHEMATEILRQHDEGNYDWRDIAVLVRTNNEAQAVVNFLLEKYPTIRVASLEALRVANANSVQLILNVLRLFDGGKKRKRYTEGETKEKRLDSAQAIAVTTRCEYYMRTAGMDATHALERALQEISIDKQEASISDLTGHQAASLPALIETIIAIHVPSEECQKQFAYIAAFQDAVDAYCQNHEGSIHAFLEWWDSEGEKINITGDASIDAVQVMTIHKAKGLEFGCVHLPFCNWPQWWAPKYEPELWMPVPQCLGLNEETTPPAMHIKLKDYMDTPMSCFYPIYIVEKQKCILDTLNCTYVAFTRPKQELIAWCKIESNSVSTWLQEAFQKANATIADTTMPICKYYNSEDNTLHIGEPTMKQLDEEEMAQKAAREQQQAESKDAIYSVYVRDDTSDFTQVESALADDKHIDDNPDNLGFDTQKSSQKYADEDETTKHEGIVLHEIMSKIVHVDDLDHALQAATIKYRLSPGKLAEYRQIVEQFMDHKDTDRDGWYVDFDTVYIEQTIYFPRTGISKRPDRVVVRKDGTVDVIDYKFSTDRRHIEDKEHVSQVQLYMGAMRALGHQRVRGFICYPRLGATSEITQQSLCFWQSI